MNYKAMPRAYIPKIQSDRTTWELIKANKPLYAEFLRDFNKAFGSHGQFYYGGWKIIGAIE